MKLKRLNENVLCTIKKGFGRFSQWFNASKSDAVLNSILSLFHKEQAKSDSQGGHGSWMCHSLDFPSENRVLHRRVETDLLQIIYVSMLMCVNDKVTLHDKSYLTCAGDMTELICFNPKYDLFQSLTKYFEYLNLTVIFSGKYF